MFPEWQLIQHFKHVDSFPNFNGQGSKTGFRLVSQVFGVEKIQNRRQNKQAQLAMDLVTKVFLCYEYPLKFVNSAFNKGLLEAASLANSIGAQGCNVALPQVGEARAHALIHGLTRLCGEGGEQVLGLLTKLVCKGRYCLHFLLGRTFHYTHARQPKNKLKN